MIDNLQQNLSDDLDYVLAETRDLWDELRGKCLFITGGTSFFGCWLLESFLWANEKLGLGSSAVVLTRNVAAFERRLPWLAAHASLRFIQGDIRSFEFPRGGFSHIVHAATEAPTRVNEGNPLLKFDTSFRLVKCLVLADCRVAFQVTPMGAPLPFGLVR